MIPTAAAEASALVYNCPHAKLGAACADCIAAMLDKRDRQIREEPA